MSEERGGAVGGVLGKNVASRAMKVLFFFFPIITLKPGVE